LLPVVDNPVLAHFRRCVWMQVVLGVQLSMQQTR
jgi:hypothetical protein